MPSREKCSSRAMPTPPDCTTRPAAPGCGWRTAKVASRPRPGTATPKQFGPTRRIPYWRQVSSRWVSAGDTEPGGDHHQAPHSPFPALPGHLGHLGRRHGHHHEVGHRGQVGDRRQARHTLDLLRVRVHREQRARETGVADVEQDRPPDGPFAPAGADHRDRPRGQQRGEAGHVRPLLPARHRVQVGAVRAAGPRRGGSAWSARSRRRPGAGGRPGPRRRTRAAWRCSAGRVVAVKACTRRARAERYQVLEQQGGDPPPVHVVGDGEGDLGQARRAGGLVAGQADHAASPSSASRAAWSASGGRQTRRASCSPARLLRLKKRR